MKTQLFFLALLGGTFVSNSKEFHVQAHRGASGQLLENTTAAVLEAAKLGADSIEIDVHLTRDGDLVVFHDFVLTKGCCYKEDPGKPNQKDLLILDQSTKEVTSYNVLPSFSKRMNDPYPGAKEKKYPLPTLQSMIDELDKLEKTLGRKVVMDIEIKSNVEHPKESASPKELAMKINDFLLKNKKVSQYLVRSFDLRVLKEIQKMNPKVRIAVLSDDDVADYVKHAEGIHAEILAPNAKVLSQKNIARAHAKGFKVIPWTVNDPALINKLRKLGVDGVTTDHPKRVMNLR
ncbi:hypothetical protein GW915_06785 [bacterium]|nr:hypothetical protein [bacterium]